MQESDLRKSVAELLVIRASGHLFDSQRLYPQWELNNKELKRLLGIGVGGVILFGGSAHEVEQRSKTLKSWAGKPLLICADVEEGLGQRFQGGTWLVPPLAVGQIHRKDPAKAIELAKNYGVCTGFQARMCGLNWILAPVCDINNNPNNPVINMRAWGEDPVTVSALIHSFNRGLASQGVLTCAKHFPGHGDTCIDSHLGLPILDHDLNRLKEFEFLPFKAAITSGVDSVMSAHVLLPNIDSKYPATVSPKILNLLRENLFFDGLVVTDALIMESIKKTYGSREAAVMAFAAGADLLMMPENPDDVIDAICESLLSGRVPLQRLDQALHRRKKVLSKFEASTPKLTSDKVHNDLHEIERDWDRNLAEELISYSIKLPHQVVLGENYDGINMVRVDSVLPCPFLTPVAPALSVPQEAGYRSVLSHQLGIDPWQDDPENPLALDRFGKGSFFVQLFVRGHPFRGALDNQEPWLAAIKQLQRQNRLSGLVVYGNPYLWDELLPFLNSSVAVAYSPGQMPAAQRQVLNSLFQKRNLKKGFQSQQNFEFTD